MPKGNTQSISSLILPQTIEGVDFRTLDHGLDGCKANSLIAEVLGKGHECGKAMCMTARTLVASCREPRVC